MGKLIVTEFLTLDGVMEAPGGEPTHPHAGWVFDFMGPEQEALQARRGARGGVAPARPGDLRKSFAGAWPKREGEFAEKINAMPKYVVSSTLSEPLEWNNSNPDQGDVARRSGGAEAPPGGARSWSRAAPPWSTPCWIATWSTSCA